MEKYKQAKIKLQDLKLDINNPRFAELYSGSKNEDDLIEYLLNNESAIEVAKGIIRENEFYIDRPLWVIKENDQYLVKDGNRRCAAVKALYNPKKYSIKLSQLQFKELPVLIYKNKEDLKKRIIQEHTNSLFREWDRIAKALKIYELHSSGTSLENMREIVCDNLIPLIEFLLQEESELINSIEKSKL